MNGRPLAECVFIRIAEFAKRTQMSRATAYRWCAKHGVIVEDGRIVLAELREKAFSVWFGLIQAEEAQRATV